MNNSKVIFVFFALIFVFSFAFVSAQTKDTINSITLNFPAPNAIIETSSDTIPVAFYFVYNSQSISSDKIDQMKDLPLNNADVNKVDVVPIQVDPRDRGAIECKLYIRTSDDSIQKIPTIFDQISGNGKVETPLSIGNYKWAIYCFNSKDGSTTVSEERILQIITPVIIIQPPVNNTNSTNNTTIQPPIVTPVVKVTKEEEGGGRRVRNNQNVAPQNSVVPLSNPSASPENGLKTSTSESSASTLSKITGAVVGVFGDSGTQGVVAFILILGLVALVVYARRSGAKAVAIVATSSKKISPRKK